MNNVLSFLCIFLIFLQSKPYHELLEEVINSNDPNLLRNFILTVGVVSNHGNWFTAEDHNKE